MRGDGVLVRPGAGDDRGHRLLCNFSERGERLHHPQAGRPWGGGHGGGAHGRDGAGGVPVRSGPLDPPSHLRPPDEGGGGGPPSASEHEGDLPLPVLRGHQGGGQDHRPADHRGVWGGRPHCYRGGPGAADQNQGDHQKAGPADRRGIPPADGHPPADGVSHPASASPGAGRPAPPGLRRRGPGGGFKRLIQKNILVIRLL